MIKFENRNATPSTSSAHFSQVPRADIERSKFDRSHTRRMSMNTDLLYPILVDEVLPGDTFHCDLTTLGRVVALKYPILDNMYADVFYIYVPNRLLSSKWESICGKQPSPGTDVSHYALTPLKFVNQSVGAKSLNDYLGISPVDTYDISGNPTAWDIPITIDVSPLWHLAYNFIWNELFRDENLQDPVYFDPAEMTAYHPNQFKLLPRGKRHDYFTSALPWPQKGPDVFIPLEGDAPVIGLASDPANVFSNSRGTWFQSDGSHPTGSDWSNLVGAANLSFKGDPTTKVPKIFADLSMASATTINSLRQAFQLQRLYERDARGGTRYIETLLSHFGVQSPDFRLQRPEFLGGGSTRINISPLPQLSQTNVNNPIGTLGAIGAFSHHGARFTKSFVEHGVILGLMAIRSDITYQQGLPRHFSKFSRLDFAWPVFAHLGEQPILNQELWLQSDTVLNGNGTPVNRDAFGFQERYAEYRYKPSEVCAELRSTYHYPLDYMHLAQEFGSLPQLGEEFIESDTPLGRCVSVPSQDEVVVDMAFKLHCTRPLPLYGVPGLIDHF